MSLEFSVVIPTYNRSNQLSLTLAALEMQSFPREKFEVIVVDDGSTDATKDLLMKYRARYKFTFVSENTRRGPAAARNLGISQARGKYVLFCDADYLVLPDLLQSHYLYHSKYKNIVLSDTPYCYTGIYTQYFPDFSPWEKKQMQYFLEKTGLWKKEFLRAEEPIDIITPEDILRNMEKIKLVLGGNFLTAELENELLKTDVAPWLLFITRCVSVKKEPLLKAGGFDERLVRGAGEDWELGYRLHRLGLSFLSVNKVTGFHQEHPHAYRTLDKNFLPFYKVLHEKFGSEDPELLLLSIWDSSDEIFGDIPKYKNTLRLLKEKDALPDKTRHMADLLIKSCKR
ncbi:glycosyltransferase family 2 protein [Dethiobacter alkaliphilus]|uniref:Glycosyl transferase family 2 n=1 Tax=Dethiobacter alkaliphilus AHT 1 TaxID=555088 RepID=C0GHI3_DETAL|nr:glycosyltransferase family 2 protein [Dethiobacter alkaliphilus]EEG77189.1 glycosyl transferase family 2 [Dethiobacter alkaliphilus AHT 1]